MNKNIKNSLKSLIGLSLSFFYLIPVFWMFISSLKDDREVYYIPPHDHPGKPHILHLSEGVGGGRTEILQQQHFYRPHKHGLHTDSFSLYGIRLVQTEIEVDRHHTLDLSHCPDAALRSPGDASLYPLPEDGIAE